MEHNDFEKLFKHQLEELSPDDFPFEEGAWDEVEGTLNSERILMPPKRKWGGVFPFTILLLVLSNALVGWKYFSAEQEIQTLNATVLQLQNGQNEALTQELSQKEATKQTPKTTTEAAIMPTDNDQTLTPNIQIVEKIVEVPVEKIVEKIVYVPVSSDSNTNPAIPNNSTDKNNGNITNGRNITDTSANTDNLEGNVSKSDAVSSQNNQDNQEGKANNGANTNGTISKTDASNVADKNTDGNNIQSENNNTDSNTNQADEIIENNTIEKVTAEANLTELELIELTNIDNELVDSLNTEDLYPLFDTTSSQKTLTLADRLKYIDAVVEVSNYELGASSGIDFAYQGTDFSMFSTRYGITNELSISEYIKIGATIDFKQTKGELEDISTGTFADDYFDIFPNTVSSVNPNDLLNKIEYRDRAVEFSIFAKYIMKPHDKLTPYFGAGIKGEYDYEQRFEYYFIDPSSGLEYEAGEYQFFNNNQFSFNTFVGLLGAEYNLTPSITVRIDGMYNYDYKAHRFNNSQLQWFSGNLGILYKFK